MDDQIIITTIVSVSSIAVATITGYSAVKSQINKQINNENEKQKTAYKTQIDNDLKNVKGLDDRIIKNISDQTLEISYSDKMELINFVENNRIKIGLLEILGVEVSEYVYYNFAIYYAFINSDFNQAKYFIDKSYQIAVNQNIEEKIPLLRWFARIERLNRNENEAQKILTNIINCIKSKNFENRNKIDDLKNYLSCLYRSRGYCYFNIDQYDGAIDDFSQSIKLANKDDIKLAYAYLGLAMSYLYKYQPNADDSKNFEEIYSCYIKAIDIDKLFYAANSRELEDNIIKLTDLNGKRRFYISEREKEGIRKLFDFISKHNG